MTSALKASQLKKSSTKVAKICTGLGITVSIGSFLADYLPHTFFIDRYKTALQMLRVGQEVPLDSNLKELFHSVLDDLKLSNEDKEKFEPFTIGGFEVYHAGIPSGKFHAIIGLPINFTYQDVQSIDSLDIRIGLNRDSLNIYHPAAQDLLESLVLSDKAKKFAIAREVLMAQNNVPIYRSIESPIIFTASVMSAEFLRVKMNLSNKPLPLTILTFGVSAVMGIMTWFQIRDAINTYYEKQVDKELAKYGQDYIYGGREYYNKILKRNIALRTLLGAYGAKVYKKDGDEVITIRQKRTPVSHRRKFFDDYTFTDNTQEVI
ncbi:transmembrane protein 177 [Phymastichus coffea]|uniref:transmembrane protein 177 n=1 Tax=Phymastichus coffea TaxID=108790 RepID=UPI00273CF078|nr:transmembrane protein 177 [Phymastichus coffea]